MSQVQLKESKFKKYSQTEKGKQAIRKASANYKVKNYEIVLERKRVHSAKCYLFKKEFCRLSSICI